MALKKKWEERFAANQADYDAAINKAQYGMNEASRQIQANTALQDAQRRVAAANLQNTNANLARRTQQNPAQTPQGANTNPMTSEDVMNQWMNRGPFQYDMNADAMYQHYKDQYMRQGRLAMQDTIGRASALTGGYGNSYATAAGQQQYNEYLAGLNDKALELSQMAYQRYQDEGDRLKDAYGMLYGRERDAVADEQWNKQFEQERYEFEQNNNLNWAKMSLSEKEYELDKWYKEQGIQLSKDELNEKIRQYDKSLEYDYYKANQDNAYRYSALAQDDAQFYANLGRQDAADARDYELALMKLGDGTGSGLGKTGTGGTGTVNLKTVNYADLGFKDQYSMQKDLPEQIAQGVSSSGEYYDKLDDKLAEWIKKKYITEDEANELRKKLGPTRDMLNRWNYGEEYTRYRTPGAGAGRRLDITR